MNVKSRFLAILTVLTLLAVAATSPGTMAQTAEEAAPTANAAPTNLYGVSETGLYIVRFNDPSLASYTGGIASLAATSPDVTGDSKLNPNSAASQAYVTYLQAQHNQFALDMAGTLGRSVDIETSYLAVLNAVVVQVSHAEAAQLAAMPGVAAVYGDTLRELTTDVGPQLIQAPAIWNGDTGSGVDTRGEGVIIGVIDSGINFDHPSFAVVAGDGYTHTNPYGAGVYNGWCATNAGCNDKLIGAYAFNGTDPIDTDGHGSHTASTAGGNLHDAVFDVGADTYTRTVSGVAHRANIVAYKVCNPSCPGTASISAVNSAIMNDDVDVLNYSISGSDLPWNDPVDLAFLDASNAGIFVSASAGNSGPGPSTVAKTGPWNASVAASTHSRAIVHTLDVISPTTPAELQTLPVVPGENTLIATDITNGLRYDATNNTGCTAFAGSFDGNLALIQRGGCTFATKADNAAAAGATGVVMFNSVGGPPLTAGGLTGTPPVVMLDLATGLAVRDYVVDNPNTAEVTINAATSLVFVPEWEDIVAGFSSRGPSQYELLKPDYIAPGVNILAAVAESGGDPVQYGFLQGTSMSSPHAAGAAALMVALHPTWSPAEVKSALASSAVNGLLKENGATPADPFDVGSGRLDLSLASTVGLVFDETGANYAAADPDLGGDPKTLNQPSMVSYNCLGTCVFTRTVTSVLPISVDYTVSGSGPAGMSFSFSPAAFNIPAGGTQEIVITVDASGLAVGDVAFGSVSFQTNATHGTQPGDISATGSISYTGNTTGAPTWQRPFTVGSGSSGGCSLSGTGSNVPYLVQALSVDTTGPYDLVSDQDYDGYIHLYANSFNPADQCLNLIALNDDGGPGSQILGFNLTAGTTYYLVTTAFGNADSGNFINTITGSGEITLIDIIPGTGLDVADNNLPVVVIPALPVPAISVDPTELDASQAVDTQTTQTLTILNNGGVDLDWTIAEAPVAIQLGLSLDEANAPSGGSPYELVLDAGVADTSVGVGGAQFVWLNRFTPNHYNYPITIDEVQLMFGSTIGTGGVNPGELVDIYLYEDADGNPANGALHRFTMNNQAVQAVDGVTWSVYPVTPTVTFTNTGDIIIAVVNRTAGVTPGTFPASIDRLSGSQQRSWAGFNPAPGNPPDFTSFASFDIIDNLAASLAGNWLVRGYGTGIVPCDNPADVSWLSLAPAAGTTGPESFTDVTVTFDSTGLTPGDTYNALLCVESNDPDMPLVEVPVSLEVFNVPNIEMDTTAISMTVSSGQVTHMMTISNTGQADLDWNIDTAEPIAVGPVPAAILNLPVGSDRASGATASATAAPQAILPTSAAIMANSWSEGFDDITTLPGMGWAAINNSAPVGVTGWFQGNDAVFPSHAGAPTSYIGANFNNTTGSNTISNWLLTPEITMNNGDSFSFWTRRTTSVWEDRLQVRLSTNGDSTDVGATATSVGDFTELLLDINPTYAAGGYPQVWTQYTINISGLSEATNGRIAFRYFVESGGPSGSNSDFIGIDTFEYDGIEACDTPAAISWLSASPDSGTIVPGDSDMVTVTMDATGLPLGTHEAVLCVNSNDPVTPLIEIPVSLTVEAEYSVELFAATTAITDMVGSTVTYTVHITNTGNTTDTFNIGATGTWATTAPATIELGSGEMDMFYVTVEIPANAEDGDSDMATVTATSQGDNTESDSVMLTTTAEEPVVPPTYGVELHAGVMAITGTAGTTVTYTVHITNTGNMTDTFNIGATGTWATTAPATIELGAGEMGMFYVTVQIPANAADGDSDMVTVMATSQGDNTESDSVMLTTTASVEAPAQPTIYLPLIFR